MRTGHILVRRHGEKEWNLLIGPDDYAAVKKKFKEFISANGVHEIVAEAQFYSPEGLERELSFKTPDEHKKRQETLKAQHEAHLKSLEPKKPTPAPTPEAPSDMPVETPPEAPAPDKQEAPIETPPAPPVDESKGKKKGK